MAYSNVTPPTLPSYDSVANPYYLIQFEYAIGAENWETVRFWFGAAPLTWNGSALTNAVDFSLQTYGTGSPEWTAWGVMAEAGEMALTPGPTTADTYMRLYTNHDIKDSTGAVWLAKGTVTPTEADKEAEIQIRKKSQLAGIIAAWCAPVRQPPNPTAEPVAFLYNGVGPLPGLPVVEGLDCAVLIFHEEIPGIPERAVLYLLSAPCYYKSALDGYRFTGTYQKYNWYGDERWLAPGWTDLGHPENIVLNTWMHTATESLEDEGMFAFQTLRWINFNILKADGTLIKEASAPPVPVYE